MTIANGSRHSMSYILESAFGVIPASPAMTPIRHTSTTLALSKDSLQSQELRTDRQISDWRGGNKSNDGDIGIEFSYGTFDDFLQALLGGTWKAEADTGITTISGTATGFTRAAGDFTADGFAIGDVFTSSGFADSGLNGRFVVTAVVTLTLTATPLDGQTQVIESGGGDEQLISNANVKTGVTRRSFTVERLFGDITQYLRYTGCNFNTMSLNIVPNAMVTGTFGIIGKAQTTDTAILSGETYNAATTTSPFDSFTGEITENGAAIAVVTSLDISVDNGMGALFVVGSPETLEPSIGRSNITGSLTAYFEDTTLLDKFIDETESSISFTLTDTAGNDYIVDLPRIKYSTGKPDVADESPVTITFDFQALLDSVTNTNITIERTPA